MTFTRAFRSGEGVRSGTPGRPPPVLSRRRRSSGGAGLKHVLYHLPKLHVTDVSVLAKRTAERLCLRLHDWLALDRGVESLLQPALRPGREVRAIGVDAPAVE